VERKVRFDYEGEIHRTCAAGRALAATQFAMWAEIAREGIGGGDVQRIIDLGCRVGRFSAWLRDLSGAPVVRVDRSARMLAEASADPAARGIATWSITCSSCVTTPRPRP